MKTFFRNKKVLKECRIYQMLSAHARGRHFSFHTPGHKIGSWDITELSYSDNLSCPRGCIAQAEKEIAEILGAKKSYILTDGSTSGILAMLYAVKLGGAQTIAVCEDSHKSVFNGCAVVGLTPLIYPSQKKNEVPAPYTLREMEESFPEILAVADVLFLTSPNYYGQMVDLQEFCDYCKGLRKILIVDGAHGGHLHFNKKLHPSHFADLWVDGVHKSLPALTQGAVVSASTEEWGERLQQGVDIFRTTSPSYPIMASVEYAVKYPRNERLETAVWEWIKKQSRVSFGADWTKIGVLFGANSFNAQKAAEKAGLYPEFCDGELLMFYLSPATTMKEFRRLIKWIKKAIKKYLYTMNAETQPVPAPIILDKNTKKEWVEIEKSVGRICAGACGLFPPCTPLFSIGERITQDKAERLSKANNVFGVKNGKILVVKE